MAAEAADDDGLVDYEGTRVPQAVRDALLRPFRGQKMSADAMKIMAFYDEKAVLTKPVGATAKRIRHPPPSCVSWFGFLGLVCCVYTCVNGHMAFGNRMWIQL